MELKNPEGKARSTKVATSHCEPDSRELLLEFRNDTCLAEWVAVMMHN
jgi:hypothetical protein